MVGELEITPVSAAIASYLGIDLSVEGKAARNRRGICIIVHGAPLSGKTATALDVANQYQATLITIDSVVLQALEYGTTSAGLLIFFIAVISRVWFKFVKKKFFFFQPMFLKSFFQNSSEYLLSNMNIIRNRTYRYIEIMFGQCA